MDARTNPEPHPDAEGEREALREQAERCRRLAKATYDRHTSKVLGAMADSFERSADELARKRRR